MNRSQLFLFGLVLLLLLSGCATADTNTESTPVLVSSAAPTATPSSGVQEPPPTDEVELTTEQEATLSSLWKVDDYPLYVMHYYADPEELAAGQENDIAQNPTNGSGTGLSNAWACSLFAAFGDPNGELFGRNFDWRFSPAVLLFMDPPGKHASVSMVDITYLGFEEERSNEIDNLPLEERANLLYTPLLPFDGMNEKGLVVGMAAVPTGDMVPDPAKETVGSLGIIREILDHADTTEEAVEIMASYNVDMGEGPPIHYLIADASGDGALVEYYQGEMHVIPNQAPYHQATNFIRSAVEGPADGACWRYDEIEEKLVETEGRLPKAEALELLSAVSQPNTQWSVVYGMQDGDVLVAMGRNYEKPYTFDSQGSLR